jgi:CO/xanthine dehydrogenase FAD-binding subunit
MVAQTLLRSRKLISPFAVHSPATVDAALALKASLPDSAFMAGGIELADRLKNGVRYSDLIRLDAIPELLSISSRDGWVHIGAAVPHRLVSEHPIPRRHLPAFADAIATIGSPRIRTQGTIGGNLMSGVWHYDVLPMLMALSAKLIFATGAGDRLEQVAEAGLPVGPSSLLLSIAIPIGSAPRDFHFQRIDKPVLSLAVAPFDVTAKALNARVVLACSGHPPALREIRVDIGDAAESSVKYAAAEWRESLTLAEDRVASAWYRAELAEVRLRRLLNRVVSGLR